MSFALSMIRRHKLVLAIFAVIVAAYLFSLAARCDAYARRVSVVLDRGVVDVLVLQRAGDTFGVGGSCGRVHFQKGVGLCWPRVRDPGMGWTHIIIPLWSMMFVPVAAVVAAGRRRMERGGFPVEVLA
jgi:hypothetical protein